MKTYRLSDHIPYAAFPDAPGPSDDPPAEPDEDAQISAYEHNLANLEDLFNDLNQLRP